MCWVVLLAMVNAKVVLMEVRYGLCICVVLVGYGFVIVCGKVDL